MIVKTMKNISAIKFCALFTGILLISAKNTMSGVSYVVTVTSYCMTLKKETVSRLYMLPYNIILLSFKYQPVVL